MPAPASVRRPPPLHPGACIAVVAPASGPRPRDRERYEAGLDRLRDTYTVRLAWTPGSERGYLAASDADRAHALNAAIADPDVRGIVCVRGGYGSLRLLTAIDYASAQAHPTVLIGYSDVTALHLALYHRAGWTGVSGPVVTEWAGADDATLDAFQSLVTGATPALDVPPGAPLQSLADGRATGRVLGGNLSVLTRLLGTPFCPDFAGSILVLEDVDEKPYAVDRMLAHLQLAGVLDAVAGVVIGDLAPADVDDDTPTLSLDTVLDDYFADRPYPVATGLVYGHCLPRVSLPLGVRARLDVSNASTSLDLLDPVVDSS